MILLVGLELETFFSSKGFSLAATSSEVSGTALHQTVKVVGNNLGVKFKPWEAVNIAKNLGKFFFWGGYSSLKYCIIVLRHERNR